MLPDSFREALLFFGPAWAIISPFATFMTVTLLIDEAVANAVRKEST